MFIHIQDNGFLLRHKKGIFNSSSSRYPNNHTFVFVFVFFSKWQSHKRITLPTLLKTNNCQPFLHRLAKLWSSNITLNLNSLIDLVLQKTQLFGYKNLAMMKGFVRITTDPTLKIPYASCVADYESAIKSIEEAQEFSSSMSYKLASQAAFKAFNSVSSCEAQLQGRENVPVYVPQRNLMIKRMCTIDNVFSIVLTS